MWNKTFSFVFIFMFSLAQAQQNANQTLFTIAGSEVKVSDFTRVYTKNNINNQADFSKASLDEYLQLYRNFRLKVKEAESLGLDTLPAFKTELESYRKQLVPNYITDKKATENLVVEAYNRLKEEVEVSHILIFWPNSNPSKADSLKVMNELKKIKAEAEKTSFNEQIAIYGKNNSNKYPNNKQKYESGNIGYVTAFQTVYPFENAMYNTPVGKISEPVATAFGYHLVYVTDKRAARGKMETAHLLIKSKNEDTKENQENAKTKIDKIYAELQSGTLTFENAVSQYSEDKKSKFQGGMLPMLSGAEMLETYADAVFALTTDGAITAPVKTEIGWHIIKRIKKEELPTFDIAKADIEKKVNRDTRSNVANELMIADTKQKFGFTENALAKKEVIAHLNQQFSGKEAMVLKTPVEFNKTLFTIGNKNIMQTDFISVIQSNRAVKNAEQAQDFESKYQNFLNSEITKYREAHLEEISEEFRHLMQEYHDGILLFELTNKEVWNKAVEDTAGLKTFFESHKQNYMWKDRITYTVYTAKDQKTADKLKAFLSKGKNDAFLEKKLNAKESTFTLKYVKDEKDSNDFVKLIAWKKGNLTEETNLDGSVVVSYVTDILPSSPKALNETRGYVISDFQNQLEKEWLETLGKKYPIVVNQEVFNSLIKK